MRVCRLPSTPRISNVLKTVTLCYELRDWKGRETLVLYTCLNKYVCRSNVRRENDEVDHDPYYYMSTVTQHSAEQAGSSAFDVSCSNDISPAPSSDCPDFE